MLTLLHKLDPLARVELLPSQPDMFGAEGALALVPGVDALSGAVGVLASSTISRYGRTGWAGGTGVVGVSTTLPVTYDATDPISVGGSPPIRPVQPQQQKTKLKLIRSVSLFSMLLLHHRRIACIASSSRVTTLLFPTMGSTKRASSAGRSGCHAFNFFVTALTVVPTMLQEPQSTITAPSFASANGAQISIYIVCNALIAEVQELIGSLGIAVKNIRSQV